MADMCTFLCVYIVVENIFLLNISSVNIIEVDLCLQFNESDRTCNNINWK